MLTIAQSTGLFALTCLKVALFAALGLALGLMVAPTLLNRVAPALTVTPADRQVQRWDASLGSALGEPGTTSAPVGDVLDVESLRRDWAALSAVLDPVSARQSR